MKYWSLDANLDVWAVLLFVRWINDENLRMFSVHLLCFSVTYERWASE